ncbi:glycerophosphodiester phosphodiesterase [Halalkalibacillus sediminis]|uniref:Glycerophosphodiester phosphodiesterase n=1 Tax=Halalkalibacillus sediminis TaxID=2018042 RepID=A0A2I0QVQ3_9BACI|nr:glycerophosphodiester phosphodiesterase [Halalkalibacillus sediminis]PKR78417.1 glycerophosphodiester phosphodiesterase [Halalkalibacillus sediminis]
MRGKPEQKRSKQFNKFIRYGRFTLFISLSFVLLLSFWTFHLSPVQEVEQHPFFNKQDSPWVIAHRAGEAIAPGNSMTAIEMSHEMGVDMIEVDIHITKDDHLVLMHDPTVDRTTDGTGLVADYTLEEFLLLDAGYHFEDLNGEYSFRGLGVYKPTLREVFEKFPDVNYMLEVKHTNPAEKHDIMTEKLWELIQEYDMQNNVMVSSFDQKLINKFEEVAGDEVALGTGRQIAFNFIMAHNFFVRNLFQPTSGVIQIPKENRYFNFFNDRMIDGAQRLGMDVHYWTINDEATMREMVDEGVDGIITDRPDLLIEILEEKGLR